MTVLSGTPHKRVRRTRRQLRELDERLHQIVWQHAPCTVRQAYYLAVVAGLCPKDTPGYNLVQRRLLDLRRSGRVPYAWIVDNARSFYGRERYPDLEAFGVAASRDLYHHDYWARNPVNVEVWVESDSIAGTLRRTVVDEWGLRLHVARGFSSETFLFNAGQELQADGRPTHVYVLSDFDPSGVTLAEDIARKLVAFSGAVPVSVERIALSGDQVRAWELPTHPLKKTDRRAARFRREHGTEACELEAIPPNLLRRLASHAIGRHITPGLIEAAKRDEAVFRESLRQLPEWFRGAR